MVQVVAEKREYSIKVDTEKNRVYLSINGFWGSVNQVSDYLSDWEKAVDLLEPGFTLLTDAREMKIHPAEVRELHKKAQKFIVDKGVAKVAELQKEKISQIQLDGVSKETAMPKMNFNDSKEAEIWLDKELVTA